MYNEMKEEIKNLIGKTIEVNTHGEVKEILVKDVFVNQNDKCLIEDIDGNIYPEDDINWKYKLTLGACLMTWPDKYEAKLKDLFNLLIKQGYISSDENG